MSANPLRGSRSRAARESTAGAEPRSAPEVRREQIARAAVELFSEKGYFQTTTDDIAARIGVGKGLIYRYFKDKNDVLLHALRVVLEESRSEDVPALLATLGPLAALQRVLVTNCTVADEHTQEFALAYRSTKDLMPAQRRRIKEIESKIVDEIRQCLTACIREGLMRPFDTKIMAYQFLMYGHMWALKKWALRGDFTLSAFIAEGERLLIVPFLTDAGRKQFKPVGGTGSRPKPVRP